MSWNYNFTCIYKIIFLCVIAAVIILNQLFSQQIIKNNTKENELKNFYTIPLSLNISHNKIDNNLADFLYKNTRVLCWILTTTSNYNERARHVRNSWGKRCNKLLLIGSKNQEDWDSIYLPVKEGRDYLSFKTKAAFLFIYENHINEAEWFLKADDDTYVIMENLRYFLYPYNSQTPIYFGNKLILEADAKKFNFNTYMSGGAGYVLSKEALTRFYKYSASNIKCNETKIAEDYFMGKCLRSLGVIHGDSRDKYGWHRFYPVDLNNMIKWNKRDVWLWTYQYYKGEKLCCSEYTISFHYINPYYMYAIEFLLYSIRKYGIVNNHPILPKKLTINSTMPPPIN